jgi:group I intron endonuclease
MISGVYTILNTVTSMVYVGHSSDVRRRWAKHQGYLNSGVHHCRYLQNAWNKHGGGAFIIQILFETSDPEMMVSIEQEWMDQYRNEEKIYNTNPAARTSLGCKRTPETLFKMSEAQKGRTHPPESRAKMGIVNRGRIFSTEHRSRIGDAHRGKVISPEQRAKLRKAALAWRNKKISEERT